MSIKIHSTLRDNFLLYVLAHVCLISFWAVKERLSNRHSKSKFHGVMVVEHVRIRQRGKGRRSRSLFCFPQTNTRPSARWKLTEPFKIRKSEGRGGLQKREYEKHAGKEKEMRRDWSLHAMHCLDRWMRTAGGSGCAYLKIAMCVGSCARPVETRCPKQEN